MKKCNIWFRAVLTAAAAMLMAMPAYAQEAALPEGVYIGDI